MTSEQKKESESLRLCLEQKLVEKDKYITDIKESLNEEIKQMKLKHEYSVVSLNLVIFFLTKLDLQCNLKF